MMMLTLPIFVPLAHYYGFDLIWFGVIVLLAVEMSLTMPPMGLLLFVMKGVAPPGTRLQDIWLAVIPFMACAAILLILLILFPDIALWLPELSKSPVTFMGCGDGLEVRPPTNYSVNCATLSVFCSAPIAV